MEETKEFSPITSQEAFDSAIKARLDRQNEKHSKELAEVKEHYADYDAVKASLAEMEGKYKELEEKYASAEESKQDYDSKIADYESRIKQYEADSVKTKIAAEMGLTYGATEFLKGETEDEIRASAEKLKSVVPGQVAPLGSPEPKPAEDGVTAAFRQLNPNIKF